MKTTRTLMAATVLLVSGTAFAQNTSSPVPVQSGPTRPASADVQRDINQQNRVEQGLKSGQLSTKEAAQLEAQEAHVDKMEQRDMAKGPMTPQEQAQLKAAQNRVSQDIKTDRNNSVKGDANSASSERMQQDVQHSVNQQQRIENGMKTGQVSNAEAANLEHGQSRVNQAEAYSGANGGVSKKNQAVIDSRINNQSDRVHNARKNQKGQ